MLKLTRDPITPQRNSTFQCTNRTMTQLYDMPDGLLARAIVQHLPWHKRVQVEGVSKRWQREALTHGWKDVKRLRWGLNHGGVFRVEDFSWLPLLSRVGPHLSTFELYDPNEKLEGAALREGLDMCPRLKNLALGWRHLTPPTLRYFCTPTLRSLSLDHWYGEVNAREAAAMLTEALSHLPSLERLIVRGGIGEPKRIRPNGGLHFAGARLGSLQNVEFHYCYNILDESSFSELATLPALRSFTCWPSVENLSFLKHLPQLVHLETGVSTGNVWSFTGTFPQLGMFSLKALELVEKPLSISLLRCLISNIVAYLPRLEHLGLSVDREEAKDEEGELRHLLTTHLPQLKGLRSLVFGTVLAGSDWSWLVGVFHQLRQLEYLELRGTTPLPTLCGIISSCKLLRSLKLVHNYAGWERADLQAMVQAATPVSVSEIGGDGGGEAPPLLPKLYVGVAGAYVMQNHLGDESRLRFVNKKNLYSRVLDHYQFGHLSEGKHAFTVENL